MTCCVPHVPKPQRSSSVREGLFRKDEFRYDAGLDAYVCPAGKLLTPIAAAGCAISTGPITATRKPAALASCARDARATPAPFSAAKTRPKYRSHGRAPEEETGEDARPSPRGGRASRSAASSSGCIRAPS